MAHIDPQKINQASVNRIFLLVLTHWMLIQHFFFLLCYHMSFRVCAFGFGAWRSVGTSVRLWRDLSL